MNNTTTSELTFKVGDRVESKWGETTITGIEIAAPGEKYGHKVEYATMAQKEAGMVVIDMANKHWARSDDFEVIDTNKRDIPSFDISKHADNDYVTVTLEKGRIHELASGRIAIFLEEDECERLGKFAEAIKIDRILSRKPTGDEVFWKEEEESHHDYDCNKLIEGDQEVSDDPHYPRPG